jgi:DNA-binding ferritin-like protein
MESPLIRVEIPDQSEQQPQYEDLNIKLSNFIAFTLLFSVQTHIYHLLTKSNAEHIALKEFYDDIRDDADKLAEKLLALGGYLKPLRQPTVIWNYHKSLLLEQLSDYRNGVTTMIEATKDSDFISLNDVFVDIQGDIDTLVYKLELK